MEGGYAVTLYVVAAETLVTRRDDLRGIWEVDGVGQFNTKDEALEAAGVHVEALYDGA